MLYVNQFSYSVTYLAIVYAVGYIFIKIHFYKNKRNHTVQSRGNIALKTFSSLLAQVPLELVIYPKSSPYAFHSKVALHLATCVNFQKQAIFTESYVLMYYNALLHCKHLPTPRFVFLKRRANIVHSFVSIMLTITLSFVTSRMNTGNLLELK